MKKMVSLFLALTMLSLTACGGAQSAPPSGEEANAAKTSVSAQSEQSAEQAESGADTQSPAQEPKGGSTLIVYFSESGNTETIANYIHEAVGGDIARIVSVVEYPHEYEELADYAKGEQDRDERPAFEDLGVDPTSYDTVFIGYPIWWYSLPMILETFFDTYM